MRALCLTIVLIWCGLVAFAASSQSAEADKTPLDGASSLSETHGDWVINCEVVKNVKLCRMSQQQLMPENNNQRLLAIEFLPQQGSVLNGTLAMPFGLALAKAVALSVDDTKIGEPAAFSTCYVLGCVVPLKMDTAMADQLKAGTVLGVEAIAADTQQPIRFKISLKGFASALNKLQKLTAP
jgi:invasion protein IalB